VKQSIKCFNQPVSYKNPTALRLPVTYVAFVPKDKSAEERAGRTELARGGARLDHRTPRVATSRQEDMRRRDPDGRPSAT
jgi:hypothetical protein